MKHSLALTSWLLFTVGLMRRGYAFSPLLVARRVRHHPTRVATGRSGTDVARQAADMILTDDNFASFAAAIEEGRAIYDNVRKFATYIFASNVPEIVPFVPAQAKVLRWN